MDLFKCHVLLHLPFVLLTARERLDGECTHLEQMFQLAVVVACVVEHVHAKTKHSLTVCQMTLGLHIVVSKANESVFKIIITF